VISNELEDSEEEDDEFDVGVEKRQPKSSMFEEERIMFNNYILKLFK
jgi:hypothetical protein